MGRHRSDIRASAWTPPPEMLRIAKERTSDIRRAWIGRLTWTPMDLATLAESAYMQGINDCADALAQSNTLGASKAISDENGTFVPLPDT